MTVTVRPLLPDDWRILRDLRLAALLDAPYAFGSTYESTAGRTEQEWRTWPIHGVAFGAFLGGEPVGMVGALPMPTDPATVHLIAMWVAPAGRGTGLGDALIDAVVAWARGRGCVSVFLEVATGNDRAAALYLRNGFAYTDEPPSMGCAVTMRRWLP